MGEEQKNKFDKMLKYYLMLNDKQQIDIVNDLGYDKSTVSSWCSGNRVPKLDVVIELANYLHINPGDLLVDEGNTPDYYYDDDAREAAEFLHSNPDYKVLFDATRNVSADDINTVKDIIDHYRKKDD